MSDRSVTVDLDLKRADFLANVDRLADRIENSRPGLTPGDGLAHGEGARGTSVDGGEPSSSPAGAPPQPLNAGEWTPAGGGLEIRIHEARPC